MSIRSARLSLTPASFQTWGRFALVSGFLFALLILFWFTWVVPDLIVFIPALLLGGLVAVWLFQFPLLNLTVLLAGFVLLLNYTEGIQATEALYGLYFLGFLAHWFATRLFLYRENITGTPEDRAILVFLVLVTCSLPLTFLFGGSFKTAFSEWIALMMLALYFPIKEVCERHRNGVRIVLLVLVWIGLFVALRNIMEYRTDVASAKFAWQVMRGRVIQNDHLLMVSSLFALVFFLFSERLKSRLPLLFFFLISFGGLILTLSRGYWIAFAFGSGILFLLVDWRHKARLFLIGTVGLVGGLAIGMLFFGDFVLLILNGLIERFTSIGSAASRDVSLISRIVEARGAFEKVRVNPILGHGMGVPFYFHDLISRTTVERTFIHNGYLSLFYRFGVWGPILVFFFWGRSVLRGFQVFRMPTARTLFRVTSLAAATTLTAFTLSTMTSNPFFLDDSLFIFGVLTGIIAGTYRRALVETEANEGDVEHAKT